jgi:hypothetical protein
LTAFRKGSWMQARSYVSGFKFFSRCSHALGDLRRFCCHILRSFLLRLSFVFDINPILWLC